MISRDLPIPPVTYVGGRQPKYDYRNMQPGDSIFVKGTASTYHWSRVTGFKFSQRSVIEGGVKGVRVWRVGDSE